MAYKINIVSYKCKHSVFLIVPFTKPFEIVTKPKQIVYKDDNKSQFGFIIPGSLESITMVYSCLLIDFVSFVNILVTIYLYSYVS